MDHEIIDDEQLKRLVNEVFEESFETNTELLKADAMIFEDIGLDSLDIVDLVVALQKKFKVQIRDDERIRSIRTLGDIYQFIINLKNEGHISEV
ncbi:MAG: phosphopantetheine-binding protein [Candidatus Scalindua sp.]|nr:phosphopantetheine-binding protein [Candidatus Scalindua sp.]MCR4344660.1 phosphopantetheine-binding protein [Candidatus Scalindua sp.]